MISTSRITLSTFDLIFGEKPIENIYSQAHDPITDAWNILAQWITPKSTPQETSEDVLTAVQYLEPIEARLIEFYEDSVRNHFTQHSSFIILSNETISCYEDSIEVRRVAATLNDARQHYFHPLNILPFSEFAKQSLDRCFNSLVREYIPYRILQMKMTNYFIENPIHTRSEQNEEVFKTFRKCGLRDESEKILAEISILEIKNYCEKVYLGVWDDNILDALREWIRTMLVSGLQSLLTERSEEQELNYCESDENFIETTHGEIEEEEVKAYEAEQEDESCSLFIKNITRAMISTGESVLCDIRTNELFDIVIDFPNSTTAIHDLKSCLKRPSQRASVVSKFQRSCAKRLLQGGANTVDIISAYISTVQVFTILDPKGVLLEKVSRPIRRYLKDREDTISVLVGGMLGQEGSEINFLADILAKKPNDQVTDDLLDVNWYPDPIDAPPDFMRNLSSDILDSLTSMYENKDIFVKEIVSIFADRMLSDKTSVDDIILYVEMLKLRFGERELQNLDVMVRDMVDSRRIDLTIHELPEVEARLSKDIHATVLSRLFWPSFRTQNINLPEPIENQLAKFSESFSKVKQNRILHWLKSLGQVSIELEFEDRIRTFDVNPSQAAAISVFEKGSKSVEEFMDSLGIDDESFATSLLSFWINKGVLIKENDKYSVLERLNGEQEGNGNDEITTSSVQSAEERAIEEMKVYWSYIVGMLTNLGATPISRIHSFLKVLVPSEIKYTKSEDELERYLALKVDEEELEMVNGNYKLRPT